MTSRPARQNCGHFLRSNYQFYPVCGNCQLGFRIGAPRSPAVPQHLANYPLPSCLAETIRVGLWAGGGVCHTVRVEDEQT